MMYNLRFMMYYLTLNLYKAGAKVQKKSQTSCAHTIKYCKFAAEMNFSTK